MAFQTRFQTTCSSRRGSPRTRPRSARRVSISIFLAAARGRTVSSAWVTTSARRTGSRVTRSRFETIRETSSRSSISWVWARALRSMTSTRVPHLIRAEASPTAASATSQKWRSAACAARARPWRESRPWIDWLPRRPARAACSLATNSARSFPIALNARPSARTSEGPASRIGRSNRPVCSVRAEAASRLTGAEIHWAATSDRIAPITTNHAPRTTRSARGAGPPAPRSRRSPRAQPHMPCPGRSADGSPGSS